MKHYAVHIINTNVKKYWYDTDILMMSEYNFTKAWNLNSLEMKLG